MDATTTPVTAWRAVLVTEGDTEAPRLRIELYQVETNTLGARLAPALDASSPAFGGTTDKAGEWRKGLGLDAGIGWRIVDPLQSLVSGGIHWLSPEVEVRAENEPVGEVSTFGWSFVAGFRSIAVR